MADHYAETRETTQALELYQELRHKLMASHPDLDHDLVNANHISRLDLSLAALLRRAGRPDEAAALDKNRLAMWGRWRVKLPDNPFVLRQIAALGASIAGVAHLTTAPLSR